MKFDILTIFPGIINSYASESILKRGQKNGAIEIQARNFRDFAVDKHHKVDDAPYGGGPGMVLKPEPIVRCLESLRNKEKGVRNKVKTKIVILDPAGKKFDQKMAQRFSKLDRLVLICGRYEGFDERVYKFVDEKVSVGDYVLSGGELPALTIVEAVARLVPGVLGNPNSLNEETFLQGVRSKEKGVSKRSYNYSLLLTPYSFVEYPQYTRPPDFIGLKVPKILLSGDHKKIEEWRKKKSKNSGN